MRNLAVRLVQFGILITVSAIFWWHSFYRVIAQQIIPFLGESDPTLGTGLVCLYRSDSICGEIIAHGEALGKTVYSPKLFWLGLLVLISGIVILMLERHRNSPP